MSQFQGDLAPNLAGAGSRWSEGQLRLRLVDASRLNPVTIMASYYRVEGVDPGGTGGARKADTVGRADRGYRGVSDDVAGLGKHNRQWMSRTTRRVANS